MNRKFVANIVLLVGLNLLIKPFWFFGIEVTVQNRLGNAAYGMYASLLSFAILFNFLLDFGITNFNNREIARNQVMLEKYFSHILGIKILFGLLYALTCLMAGMSVGFKGSAILFLLLLMVNQFFSSMILYLRSNINAMLMFVTDSILSVLDKFLMIVLLSIILWSPLLPIPLSIETFILAQTAALSITALVAGWIVRTNCRYFRPAIDIRHIVVIIRKSLPFTLLVFLMGMYNRLEPIFLERLLPNGNVQAGLYAQGFRILEVLSNFALLFSALLLPLFAKMLKTRDDIVPLLRTASSMLLIPALALTVHIFAFRNQWVQLLYHNPASGNVFGTIILGFPGICLTYIFGTLLTANGNFRQLNLMALLMVLLNVSLNLLFIPRWQAQGSAYASFITQTLAGIIQLVLAVKLLHLSFFSFRKVLILLLWFISSMAIIYFSQQLFGEWYYAFSISLLFSLILTGVFKLVPVRDWVELVMVSLRNRVNKNEEVAKI
ncbi:MAG: oligosaccharide flippase family protein [Bacteroidales bacterium]